MRHFVPHVSSVMSGFFTVAKVYHAGRAGCSLARPRCFRWARGLPSFPLRFPFHWSERFLRQWSMGGASVSPNRELACYGVAHEAGISRAGSGRAQQRQPARGAPAPRVEGDGRVRVPLVDYSHLCGGGFRGIDWGCLWRGAVWGAQVGRVGHWGVGVADCPS